jgi:hypothetical protein
MGEVWRGRSLGDKGELEVADDPINHGVISEESDDLHLSAALGADHRINLISFGGLSAFIPEAPNLSASSVVWGAPNRSF